MVPHPACTKKGKIKFKKKCKQNIQLLLQNHFLDCIDISTKLCRNSFSEDFTEPHMPLAESIGPFCSEMQVCKHAAFLGNGTDLSKGGIKLLASQ